MRRRLLLTLPWLLGLLAVPAAASSAADPASDAPEQRFVDPTEPLDAATYREALLRWRSAEDINRWIGAKFEYDMARALRLSETQRQAASGQRLPIHDPESFFAAPSGVCVDLARFGVEALRAVDAQARPAYLMIEFDPVAIAGNTLRRHWLVMFEREGRYYFFADSKRPGHLAGPYASPAAFIDDYAHYRGRRIVGFERRDGYERRLRRSAPSRS